MGLDGLSLSAYAYGPEVVLAASALMVDYVFNVAVAIQRLRQRLHRNDGR